MPNAVPLLLADLSLGGLAFVGRRLTTSRMDNLFRRLALLQALCS